ncbi:translocation/assembly module TamB domain-containing protein [Rhizobium helianthi]|uniref:Translocation/assembly module TamB domain-containing protein n=1 Tax=Rhizobium helianthi TaxID=1132695 RepID=A0ABW4M507_9HYPH
MTSPRPTNWILRAALAVVALAVVLVVAFVLFIGFTPAGNRLAGNLASSLVSSPDQTITISPPRGLLTGRLKLESVTLADRNGIYAQASDIAVDWSPLSLLSGTFHAQRIEIDALKAIRAPLPATTPAQNQTGSSGNGFSLPVAVQIDHFKLPSIALEPALTGRHFDLQAEGAANATGERIALQLSARRKDIPNALAKTDLVFAPRQNELKLQALVSEPQGGLLARLLHLPGSPSLALALDGQGPLSNWSGQLRGTVDGRPVIRLDGQHSLSPEGAHQLQLRGGGEWTSLLPPSFRPLFPGRTDLNIGAVMTSAGRIEIKTGELTTGSMKLQASGALDPSGDNSLTGSATATNGSINLEWPMDTQPARVSIDNLNFTLTGPAESSRFNATAALKSISASGTALGQVRLQAESEDLNLVDRTGSIRTRLSIAQAKFDNPDLDRLIEGPIRLDAPIRLAPPAIGLDASTFESANLSGTISGAYNTSKQSVTGNIRMSLNPEGLPEAAGRYFEDMVGIEGYVDAVIGGRMSLENLVVKSNVVEGHGNVLLNGGTLEAHLAGRVADIAKFRADAKGAAGYDITLNGPLDALGVKAVVNAAEARYGGRMLEAVSARFEGTVGSGKTAGTAIVSGRVDGKPLKLDAEIRQENDLYRLPRVALDAGANRISGALDLSNNFLPQGQLAFDLPDIGLLASLAGQQASGDLRGSLSLGNDNGKMSATINATGQSVSANGSVIEAPAIDLASTDVMALIAQGTVRANAITVAGQKLQDVNLKLEGDAKRTNLDLEARYSDAPLVMQGVVDRTAPDQIAIDINRLAAKPNGIDIALAEPARVRLASGSAALGTITLNAGGGKVVVEGTAGPQLNVALRVSDLPAAIADSFVPGLGAEGKIGGAATLAGRSSDPVIRYSLAWNGAQVGETRTRNLGAFTLSSRGRMQGSLLTVEDAALTGRDGLSLHANGTVSTTTPQTLNLKADIASIPASIANSFVPNLDAKGQITGTATVTGTVGAPVATAQLDLAEGSTVQTRAGGIEALRGRLDGRFENNRLTVNEFVLQGGKDLAARVTGSLNLADERAINLQADLSSIPASLANALRPDLGAVGTLSGTVNASGTLAAPKASFQAKLADASFEQTRKAGLPNLNLIANGTVENQILTLSQAELVGGDNVSLKASGTAALDGDRALNMSLDLVNLPLSLADVLRPGLDAKGQLKGRVTLGGIIAVPVVRYDLSGSDLSIAESRQAGANSIALRALGSLENNTLTLDDTSLTDPSGLSVTAKGRVLLNGPQGPVLNVNGNIASLPAALANAFVPGLDASGIISGSVQSSGTAEAPVADFNLAWQDAATAQTRAAGIQGLAFNAKGRLENGTLTIAESGLTGPSGLSAKANGTIGLTGERALNLQAALDAFPAALANAFLPGMQASGIVSGTAAVSGTTAAPAIRYDLQWADGSIRRRGDAGVGPLNLRAEGSFENRKLTLGETRLSGPNGLSVTASGDVTLPAEGDSIPRTNLNADIAALPANLANAFVPGLGATGVVSGKVTALPGEGGTGARFNLTWTDASLAQIRSAGLQSFRVGVNGSLENNAVNFQTELSGAGGLNLSGGGTVGLAGDRPLNLQFRGGFPFALLATQLSAQGFVPSGTGNVNVSVGGTASAPQITGTASTSDARLIDVRRNLALNKINAQVNFNRDRAEISSATAALSTGGTISAQGSIGLTDGFAADLRIALNDATYVDGTLVTATVNGNLTVTGPLLQDPRLGGTVTLVKANITVPAKLPASLAEINVKHRNAPADVRALLAALAPKGGEGTGRNIGLDVTLNAPNGIFVRGRGIDAELGGNLTVRGTTAEPIVAGGFEMRRGRIVILTKRLDFTTGRITFGGSLIPVLDMVAETRSDQTTITINVSGVANNPDITFGSSPSLPQDEVLARLIFGQSVSRLSALQIAQLADAVSQLAGGGDSSLFQTLRGRLGVDDLDLRTDDNGQTSVSVGRRLNDRTYFQLEQGGSSGAKASINLDIGRGVKLKGSAGSEGGSAGIFYEKEY